MKMEGSVVDEKSFVKMLGLFFSSQSDWARTLHWILNLFYKVCFF